MRIKFIQNIIDSLRGKSSIKKIYAQHGEDVIIDTLRINLSIKDFAWIDVGAYDPVVLNKTMYFYKKGFRGVNIEGDPSLYKNFLKTRKKDININALVSDEECESDFYIMNPPTLNTMNALEAKRIANLEGHSIEKVVKIKSILLSSIVDKYFDGKFPAFLNLDAEGCELRILKTIDFVNNYPKIICLRVGAYSPYIKDNFDNVLELEMVKLLRDNGYAIFAFTSDKMIFVKKDIID